MGEDLSQTKGLAVKLCEDKQRRIGATDAAGLLGVSKHGNVADLYARLVLGIDIKVTPKMTRGTRYEPVVRDMYVREQGVELMVWTTKPVILRHPEHEWATSSPDDVTTDGRLLDYKTVSVWAVGGWRDAPPIDYQLQMAWGMWVGGLESCHLYAAVGEDVGEEFRIDYTLPPYEFVRDAELEATFAEAGERFWTDHVLPKVPPGVSPMKNKRAYAKALKEASQSTKGTNE